MKKLGSLALVGAFLFFTQSIRAEDETLESDRCESALVNSHIDEAKLKAAESAAKKVRAYTEAINGRLLEREELLELIEASLLAEEHVLLVGPPGNAKSLVADLSLSNIKEDDGKGGKKSSYWKIQLTPETTQSETIGPLSPNQLFNNDVFRRLYEEGIHSLIFPLSTGSANPFEIQAGEQTLLLGDFKLHVSVNDGFRTFLLQNNGQSIKCK